MIWIARPEKELKKIIDISNEFYELNDIEINSKKSELLVLNRKENDTERGSTPRIKVGEKKEIVQVKKVKEAIRHLGVWISEKGSKECNETVITREVARMCKVLVWKKASVSQLVYLNNSVLMPSIEYRLQMSFLSKASCKRIQRPIWTLIKNKIGLAKSAPNSMCSHIKILGMRTIWQNQLAHHITELTIRMNKQDELGVTTRLRIREAQLKSMYLSNIISNDKKLDDIKLKFNLALRVISEANRYKNIEEEVLENSNSRKVKEKYQVEASNRIAIRCKDIKVSADKRKKEWIIFEKGLKVESGKVIKKESRSLIVEHWQIIG